MTLEHSTYNYMNKINMSKLSPKTKKALTVIHKVPVSAQYLLSDMGYTKEEIDMYYCKSIKELEEIERDSERTDRDTAE